MRAACIGLALLGTLPLASQAATPVKVNIAWEYKDFAEKMEVREIKGKPRLWETKVVKASGQAPVGEKIVNSAFVLEPGQIKRFALVVKNESDRPVYFFSAPHVAQPVEHSLGFKFKCLCIDHAYSIGPKETWYRIVEFRLSKEFVGPELTVTHTIIGIDKTRAEAFSMGPTLPE